MGIVLSIEFPDRQNITVDVSVDAVTRDYYREGAARWGARAAIVTRKEIRAVAVAAKVRVKVKVKVEWRLQVTPRQH